MPPDPADRPGLTAADVATVLSLSFWQVWPVSLAVAIRLTAVAALMALARLRISEISALLFDDWPKNGGNFFTAEYHGVRRPVAITPELRFAVNRYLRTRPKTDCGRLFVTRNGTPMTSTMMRIPIDRATRRLKLPVPLHRMLLAFCTNAHLDDGDPEAAGIVVGLPRGKGRHAPRVSGARLLAVARRCNPLRKLRPVLRRPAMLAGIRRTHPTTLPATWKEPRMPWTPRRPRRRLRPDEHPVLTELAAVAWPERHAGRVALRNRLFAEHFATVHGLMKSGAITKSAAAALFRLSQSGYGWRAARMLDPEGHERQQRRVQAKAKKALRRRRGEEAAARARQAELTPEEAAVVADIAGTRWPTERRAFLARRRDVLKKHLGAVCRLVDGGRVSMGDMAMLFRLCRTDMATQIRQARNGRTPRMLREHPRLAGRRAMMAKVRTALEDRPEGDSDKALHRRLRKRGFKRDYATMRNMLAEIRRAA